MTDRHQELFNYLHDEFNAIATQTEMSDIESIVMRNAWRDIESAPRDGTHILGYWNTMRITDFPAVVFNCGEFINQNEFNWLNNLEYGSVFPTKWMPIPKPEGEK